MYGAVREGNTERFCLAVAFIPLTVSPLFRSISGASRHLGNLDLEPFERSAVILKPFWFLWMLFKICINITLVVFFSPTLCDITGSTGGARRESVDSVARFGDRSR